MKYLIAISADKFEAASIAAGNSTTMIEAKKLVKSVKSYVGAN